MRKTTGKIPAIEAVQFVMLTRYSLTYSVVLSIASAGLGGCTRSDNSPAPIPERVLAEASPTPATAFERDLQFIRQGNFTHIYLFSRKDGRLINKDDGDYLRQNAPRLVDVVLTDGGMKAIGGTNFELEATKVETLRKRFNIEDYSGK